MGACWLFDLSSADFDECGKLPTLGPADAFQSLEIVRLPTGESGYGPGLGDQL
jgi:hypothetical protein